MAIRTTEAEVRLIMSECSATSAAVTAIISAASGIVDRVFEYNTDLSATTLESIEQFLTAHIIASAWNRTATEEKVGDAAVKYTGTLGKGLESTPYGQAVLLLDTTGLMSRMGKMAATIRAIESFD